VYMACAALGMYLVRLRLRACCSRAAKAFTTFTLSCSATAQAGQAQSGAALHLFVFNVSVQCHAAWHIPVYSSAAGNASLRQPSRQCRRLQHTGISVQPAKSDASSASNISALSQSISPAPSAIGGPTDVLLSGALEWDLRADNADKDADLIGCLIYLVSRPVNALQCSLCYDV